MKYKIKGINKRDKKRKAALMKPIPLMGKITMSKIIGITTSEIK